MAGGFSYRNSSNIEIYGPVIEVDKGGTLTRSGSFKLINRGKKGAAVRYRLSGPDNEDIETD